MGILIYIHIMTYLTTLKSVAIRPIKSTLIKATTLTNLKAKRKIKQWWGISWFDKDSNFTKLNVFGYGLFFY